MSLQLPTILSPPTPCTPVPTLTSRRRSGRGVTVLPFPGGFRSGLRLYLAGSLMHQAVSSSSFCYLWTGRSLQVAPHPASRRRSFLQLRTASAPSDGDFHPTVGAHSQAHQVAALPHAKKNKGQ